MRTLALSVSLALAGTAFPAAAQNTSAWSSISGYEFTLVDLDPGDGIAPSITLFNDQTAYSYAEGYSPFDAELSTAMSINGEPVTAAATGGFTHAESTFSQEEISSSGNMGWGGEYFTSAGWYSEFTLSPRTSLVITGHAQAEVIPGTFAQGHYARAYVLVTITGDASTATYENAITLGASPALGFDEQFTLEHSNATGAAMQGIFALRTQALGNMHPIPEPASWCMVLAGAGITGIAARRARRRNDRANGAR